MTFETKLKGVQIARDAFIISFLLCGINSADLYYIVENNGRVDYERRKTKDRRADNAFISIKIEPELLPYIDKYKDNQELSCLLHPQSPSPFLYIDQLYYILTYD